MKQIKIIGLILLIAFGFNACQQDDDVVFIASDTTEVSFTNTFLAEYIISAATAGNLGERFTWNIPDAGVPTNFTFDLQYSIAGDFSDATTLGSTNGTEIAVTIGDLLGIAAQLGLDNDPETEAPNEGEVDFRLRSVIGVDGSESFTPNQAMKLVWLEESDEEMAVCEYDQLFMVGAGIKFAGWSWDTPGVLACTGNGVYSGNVELQNNDGSDNNFRFFTVETEWPSGRNYPWYEDAGYTIDENLVNANDDDSNFAFVGTSGLYFLEIDDLNKTVTLGPPQATGSCEFDVLFGVGAGLADAGWSWDTPVQLFCSGDSVYTGWVNFDADGDANFRWFTANTEWPSGRNYPYYEDAGYTIDEDLINNMDDDDNFKYIGETGARFVTIDDLNKVISLD
ncbi:MAG: hypothetical protein HKO90_06670 [Flavobacteriaceae bacterium]|nr:SusE domain-containing protein [Bacteroidia bacterium]NNK87948.1 hypothetical protein [Flavobacteriaceae bacterium]